MVNVLCTEEWKLKSNDMGIGGRYDFAVITNHSDAFNTDQGTPERIYLLGGASCYPKIGGPFAHNDIRFSDDLGGNV